MANPDGFEQFRKILDHAVPLAELVWRMEVGAHKTDTPERRAALEAAVNQRVSVIADEAVRSQYSAMFRDRVWKLFKGNKPANRSGNWSGGRNKKAAWGGKRGKNDYFWSPAGKAVPGMSKPPMAKEKGPSGLHSFVNADQSSCTA